MWNRDDVDFVQTQDLPSERVAEGLFGARGAGRKRVLSVDHGDGAETALHRVTEPQRGVLTAGADVYVVRGDGLLGGRPLRTGHYVHVPAGAAIDLVPSVLGLDLYVGSWGTPSLDEGPGNGAAVTHTDTERMEWVPAGWSGETPLEVGAMSKVLRDDDEAFIYLAAMVPGWKSPSEESHPQYEESFKLYGDVLMGSRGVIREGGYFYRSPDVFHGPLYSRGGTMSFIRSDAATTTTYRDPAPGGAWDELSRAAYAC